ncbi:MAG: aspartate kinase [Bacteroidales bacterium]
MRILKFGGTSLGDAARLRSVAEIVQQQQDCIVVCSAMAGVTNALVEVNTLWQHGQQHDASIRLQQIERNFEFHCRELYKNESTAVEAFSVIQVLHAPLYELLASAYSTDGAGRVLALGEQVSSYMLSRYLREAGSDVVLLNALDFMHLNAYDEPDVAHIRQRLLELDSFSNHGVYVTQGFICLDNLGQVSNLKRGGSDYSATLIGAAIQAQAIEIWTDIDGLHNNDPRFVSNTSPIRVLSFAEAAELAYFGAKILHPSCVWPARELNIPILLKNTLDPTARGTRIQSKLVSNGVKAIAAKDHITVLRITSGRMFNAYGFLRKLFEVFDDFRIPVDVVTTSEVSVSVTIEDVSRLDALVEELSNLGRVTIEKDQAIICVVGDVMHNVAEILQRVKPFDVCMVSLGASSNNVTMVLPMQSKTAALQALHPLVNNVQTIERKNPCLQLQN